MTGNAVMVMFSGVVVHHKNKGENAGQIQEKSSLPIMMMLRYAAVVLIRSHQLGKDGLRIG